MMKAVATGWWCENCEFFESEDDVDTATEVCRACGCNGSEHLPVEVITRGYGA